MNGEQFAGLLQCEVNFLTWVGPHTSSRNPTAVEGRGSKRPRVEEQPSSSSLAAEAEADDATFSDVEEPPPTPKQPRSSVFEGGFDFRLAPTADASQQICPLCGRLLVLAWDSSRGELVSKDSVLLRHVMYHTECARTRRPSVR